MAVIDQKITDFALIYFNNSLFGSNNSHSFEIIRKARTSILIPSFSIFFPKCFNRLKMKNIRVLELQNLLVEINFLDLLYARETVENISYLKTLMGQTYLKIRVVSLNELLEVFLSLYDPK